MTTEEEMKRLAPSDRQYKNLCEVIDDCMIESPGISSYDMCLADYQYLLHKLRVVTYGSEYRASSTCPYCGSINDTVINLDDLAVETCDMEDVSKHMEFTLPKTGKRVRLSLQTPRSLDEVTVRNKEIKKKSRGQAPDATLMLTMTSLISTVDGEHLDPIKKEDLVRSLPMMDTNYIMKHAQKLVESFGINPTVINDCPVCGLDYTSSFRFSSEFFGPSIDI
jgi:hypothetical protein